MFRKVVMGKSDPQKKPKAAPFVRKPTDPKDKKPEGTPVGMLHILRPELAPAEQKKSTPPPPPKKATTPSKRGGGPSLRDDFLRDNKAVRPKTKTPIEKEPEPEVPSRVMARQKPEEKVEPKRQRVAAGQRRKVAGTQPDRAPMKSGGRVPTEYGDDQDPYRAREGTSDQPLPAPLGKNPTPLRQPDRRVDENYATDMPSVDPSDPLLFHASPDPMGPVMELSIGGAALPEFGIRRALFLGSSAQILQRLLPWLQGNRYAIDTKGLDRVPGTVCLPQCPKGGYDLTIIGVDHPGSAPPFMEDALASVKAGKPVVMLWFSEHHSSMYDKSPVLLHKTIRDVPGFQPHAPLKLACLTETR